ncbi:short-chain dehydrogenase [Crassisporium funariophilum]|nr:short-chain dehydrogenase [Crassisporium funariophilum]
MQLSFMQFLRDQRASISPVTHENLAEKTVVVVGANAGIGFEASKHFARMNPGRLILACRSKERGEVAQSRIKEETGYEAELWLIDLTSFASVSDFAKKFEKDGTRLDILVENAGIINSEQLVLTSDGYEPSFQVNNLSTSLLALLLLPHMLQTAEKHNTTPRLVVVASEVHYWAKLEKELIDSPNPLKKFGSAEYFTPKTRGTRYFDTKLLNVLFVRALNDRLSKKPIIVNSVNPGYCASNFRQSFTGIKAWFDWAMEKAIARTSEEGARQLIWAALGGKENLDELRGAYISAMGVHEPSDYVISEEGAYAQDKLWDNLIEELTKVDPQIRKVVDEYLVPPIEGKSRSTGP